MTGSLVPSESSRHLVGLPDGIPVVETAGFRKTAHVTASAVRDGEIAVFTGGAGLGKTFAVDHAVRSSGLPWVWLQIGPKPSPKEVTVRLLKELHGRFPSGTLYEVTDELVEALVEDPHVVVLDEAQNLRKAGMDQVRYLHDQSANGFPLLLVGGAGCADTLQSDPQLADRVGGWVKFRPLQGRALFTTLENYHPFFAATDPQLLGDLDEKFARGVFRRWARILKVALPLAESAGTPRHLTARVAAAVLAKVSNGSDR